MYGEVFGVPAIVYKKIIGTIENSLLQVRLRWLGAVLPLLLTLLLSKIKLNWNISVINEGNLVDL